jgi:hypothetical protein
MFSVGGGGSVFLWWAGGSMEAGLEGEGDVDACGIYGTYSRREKPALSDSDAKIWSGLPFADLALL